MKVAILCGGKGQRMREYTENIPKPLVNIGDRPMLWHIMKIYKHYGFNEFILLLGYKGEKIKEYFLNYKSNTNNFTLDTLSGNIEMQQTKDDDFKITFLDTGLDSMTGSRIKQAQSIIGNEPFMLTYGDGLSNINISELIEYHKQKGKIATMTGINKRTQYGTLKIQDGIATSFEEKQDYIGTINGGFFVFQPEIFNYLSDENSCVFEKEPLQDLVKDRELAVFMHNGFWTAADTYNDILELNEMCENNTNSWKVW